MKKGGLSVDNAASQNVSPGKAPTGPKGLGWHGKSILASIIISSYNYARYLREAIDSCLDQTYPDVEVIVVDDGSRDESPQIIRSYGDRIKAIFKQNGGHASALNMGFSRSRGQVVIFLDSDDALMPCAAETAVRLMKDPQVSSVRWQMWTMDSSSRVMAKKVPPDKIVGGDLRDDLLREGPHHFPPTSGNAWARWFLDRVMPIPEEAFRLGGGDLYLATLAALYGRVRATEEPQGLYRIHTDKYTLKEAFSDRLNLFGAMWDYSLDALAIHARGMGLKVNLSALKRRAWWRKVAWATRDLRRVLPEGATYILVDDDFWGTGEVVPGCFRRHFLERMGTYWGPPADDRRAIEELEKMRKEGASFLVFAWSSLWWLRQFQGFSSYLRSHYRCILSNSRVKVFDLRTYMRRTFCGSQGQARSITSVYPCTEF